MSCNKRKCRRSWFRKTCGSSWLSYAPLYALVLAAALLLVLFLRGCVCSGAKPTETMPSETVAALMYHHILPSASESVFAGNNILTDAAAFEAQLDWLAQNGFSAITPAMLEAYLYDGGALPERSVLITFDDGYQSLAEYAAPLLRKYGFCATVFLITGEIPEEKNEFSPRLLQTLDEESLASCADVFTYGVHTNEMHIFTRSGHSRLTDASPAGVLADYQTAAAVVSALAGGAPEAFSYPFGFYNKTTLSALRQGGVKLGFLASGGRITRASDPLLLPRYPVDGSVTMETFIGYLT